MKNESHYAANFIKYWLLDREVTFLNHGAHGACPLPVLEAQRRFQEQMEREPLRFFMREWEPLLDQARNELAKFLGIESDDLVFVPNVTTGVNAVLRSLSFSADDELLTTNQEYNACRNALNFVANQTGAKVIVANIPFPIESPQQVIDAVMERVTPRTKLALLDHIVSQTGLVFPIQELVQKLADQGVDTLVDGAHAPGILPLDLKTMGATYYAGNCHKWLSAPKGAGFLYVRGDKQCLIHPTVISHGANSPRTDKSRFQLEFDWMGTDDFSAYFSVPVAIAFMGSLVDGGWLELMAKNRALALEARKILSEKLGLSVPCPEEMVGAIAVLQLPDKESESVKKGGLCEIQNELWEKYQIEVPIMPWPDSNKRLLRISAQIYNDLSQYEYLADALSHLL
ncbi:MAG: hypothetical protein RLZZ338_1824 [Cyanobacteriota bacterium]|jgi:isopenicillin-N epimerase